MSGIVFSEQSRRLARNFGWLTLQETLIRLIGLVLFSGHIAPAVSITPALLVACSLLLLPPALTVVWAFRGLDQMQVTALADVVEKALTFLGLVLLVKGVGNDVLWAPLVEVAAALLVAAWMIRRLRRGYPVLRLGFRWRAWPGIAREAVPLSLAAMLSSVYLNGGVLLLGMLATAASAAMFLVAQKVMLTLALLLQVANQAAFPSISRLVLLIFVRMATGGVPWTFRCIAPLLAGAAAAGFYLAVLAWPLVVKLPLAALIYIVLVLLLKGVTISELRDLPALLLVAVRNEKPVEQGLE